MMEAVKLKSYLECPICFLLPQSKIFSCVNSHLICESCYNKLSGARNCPQGCRYDQPPHRARVCEAMIENSDLEHCCSRPGCEVEMRKDRMADHELECIFRTVPCPDATCQKDFLFKDIDSHIRDDHKDASNLTRPVVEPYLREANLDTRDNNWVLFPYQESGAQFYLVFVKRDHLWYCWVSIKDGPKAASAWVFTAKAKNDEKKMAVEFSGGFVHPVDSRVEEIIESGQYLILNRRSVEQLQVASQNAIKNGFSSFITIEFKITKV